VAGEDFPWLEPGDYYPFPPPETWEDDIVAVGGNLSPGLLLSAYAQGVFPWFNEGEEILWWSLDPRFVLYPDKLKISRSMRKVLRSGEFRVTVDRCFEDVIGHCGSVSRKGQDGTWISQDMKNSYLLLHKLGFAHSVEVWAEGVLAGGLYGISLGRCFFGESMFALKSNASKTALIALTLWLDEKKFALVDCQQHTPHLGTLGAEDVPRSLFLEQLKEALQFTTLEGNWSQLFPGFPFSERWNALSEGARG